MVFGDPLCRSCFTGVSGGVGRLCRSFRPCMFDLIAGGWHQVKTSTSSWNINLPKLALVQRSLLSLEQNQRLFRQLCWEVWSLLMPIWMRTCGAPANPPVCHMCQCISRVIDGGILMKAVRSWFIIDLNFPKAPFLQKMPSTWMLVLFCAIIWWVHIFRRCAKCFVTMVLELHGGWRQPQYEHNKRLS